MTLKFVAGGVLLLALTLIAAPVAAPARELEPLMAGWERVLAVKWQPADYHGRPAVEGYVENVSPYDLTNIRILVEGLDPAGHVTTQRVAWVPGELRGGGHLFFQVPADPAPAYRVRVFSYDRVESESDGRIR
jgi:hypothetical protein